MKRPRFLPLAIAAAVLAATSGLRSQEPGDAGNADEEKDWLEFYYLNPQPDRFVAEIKKLAKDGALDSEAARPAVIGFLSQVFRQNREKIAGWYEELTGLSDLHRQVIHTGMLLSRTTEADAILKERFGKAYDEQKKDVPKILEMNLAQKNTLDMLWGFFYATGSKDAIRRIIWSFRFEDAPDNPAFAKVPKDFRPLYKDLPDAAAWMLKSNAKRHPRVSEICRELYESEDELVPTEKRLLGKMFTTKDEEAGQ